MKVPDTREDITLEWLNEIFSKHGIKVHSFTFAGDASNGRGFMGTLEKVVLQISHFNKNGKEKSDGSPTETLHIVLKTLPSDPFRKSYAANDGFSSREVSMYIDVFKAWDNFLDRRQVAKQHRFLYPMCFYGAEEGEGDTYKYILVLENLTAKAESDFSLWGPGFVEPLPPLAVSAVIRQIARFHATGLAYKLEKNDFETYYSMFPKLNHTVSPTFHLMWNNGFENTRRVIESTVDKSEIPAGLFEQMDILQGEEQQKLLLKWFSDPSMVKGQRNTIMHHDLHSNNLVLSKDYSAAILFDYQSASVMNPMKDLSFFLVLNCSMEDVTTNLSQSLQIYHDEFETTMRAFNVDFKYSLETIKKDYDCYLVFSLIHIMSGSQVWITGKDSTDVSKRRFAMNIIDTYKKGLLHLPQEELP